MNRRNFLFAVAALLAGAAPGLAASQDSVVRQLRNQGYGSIRVSRTLLGRIRILAERPGERREIILNRATGEILRDFSSVPRTRLIGPGDDDGDDRRGGSRSGGDGSRDDDDNDDDDDDGGDDDDGDDDDGGDDDGGDDDDDD